MYNQEKKTNAFVKQNYNAPIKLRETKKYVQVTSNHQEWYAWTYQNYSKDGGCIAFPFIGKFL